MDHEAKTAVRRLGEKVLEAPNTKHFLESPWRGGFCPCGELTVTMPRTGAEPVRSAWWEEPQHKDGAASVLHMGMTLYGRRLLRCQRAKGAFVFRGGKNTGGGTSLCCHCLEAAHGRLTVIRNPQSVQESRTFW